MQFPKPSLYAYDCIALQCVLHYNAYEKLWQAFQVFDVDLQDKTNLSMQDCTTSRAYGLVR